MEIIKHPFQVLLSVYELRNKLDWMKSCHTMDVFFC